MTRSSMHLQMQYHMESALNSVKEQQIKKRALDAKAEHVEVEHVRLGIPRDVPLAVQQWDGLIAINYAARAAGITRHERVHQAIKKCPELQCVHVETIGNESSKLDAPNRGQAKVSLERYRQASASVFKIFHRFSDVCEKASIDEAYLDVTRRVEKMMDEGCNWDQELSRLIGDQEKGPEMVVVDGPLVSFNSYDRRMLAGAIIAEKIRLAVRSELGYTCSVGIATNKLLAKIASAKNKPDKQTLIPPRAVQGLMESMPLKKVKLLGGKLGEEMTEKWGVSTAGEAQALPLAALVGCFGERLGNYVWHAVRGIQSDKVQVKRVAKSMLAAKSFKSTKELSDIRRWLSILAEELSVRMVRDFEENHRHPRLLQLYYRSGDFRNSREHTKSWAMPHNALTILSTSKSHQPAFISKEDQHQERKPCDEFLRKANLNKEESLPYENCIDDEDGHEDHSNDMLGLVVSEKSRSLARVLEDASYGVFRRLDGIFPCSRLALAAGGFQDLPAPGTKSIQHFFTSVGKGISNTSPVRNAQKFEPKKTGKQIKEKANAKGMLKYLKYERPSPTQDERRRNAVEHSDNLDVGHRADDAVTPNQHGNEDHKPQGSLCKSAPSPLKPKLKGMYKFFSQDCHSVGQDQGSQYACESSDILDTGVNSHKHTYEPTDENENIEDTGDGIGRRHTPALATDLYIYQPKQAKKSSSWKLDPKVGDLSESNELGEDDAVCCHQPELPSILPDEKIESASRHSGYWSVGRHCKVEGDELGNTYQIDPTLRHSKEQSSKSGVDSGAQGVSTPDKRSFEHPLKAGGLSRVLTTPGKRNRPCASKTGQQSIAKFFRSEHET